MRPSIRRKPPPGPTLDDSLVLFCWLLGLIAAFGLTCWLCYRLLQMPPFVLLSPSLGGS
ncbi:MAG: hypothetical protein HYV96_14155 [Opitutae bacterium]|nr:hypothetical protein [Opitutae bacterium]